MYECIFTDEKVNVFVFEKCLNVYKKELIQKEIFRTVNSNLFIFALTEF